MAHGRERVWATRVGVGVALLVAAAGGYAVLNWNGVNARYAGHRFHAATSDEERAAWAAKLAALGDAGVSVLADALRGEDDGTCAAATVAIKDRLTTLTPTDPAYAGCCRPLLDGFAAFSTTGKAAVLGLVPELLACPTPDAAARGRDVVRAGFSLPTADSKVLAVRLALRPGVGLHADVVPLLDDPDAEVRRAAMLAVGPVADGGPAVVGDEELFRWLHDPDAEVRDLCEAALKTRGLDADQVHFARLLTDPDPVERLKLLGELRRGGGTVADPGPWLERLGRDADPAVRLGAARVAVETRLVFAGWLDRLADADPDPTVRRWAKYYRGLSATVKQTGGNREAAE